MILTLVIIACIWLIISIPTALFFGKFLYNLNLNYESEKTIHEEHSKIAKQPVKTNLK
ncbi:hypothetical protein NIES2098_19530 [Calothrix sp. NIES-2098]|nr:hypothetical protein NIES2098_19530 [Calothrix sp. NIES-2098]